ncbi:hypothetical protein NUU61_000853 [Penicillium alfredii]|uniref:Uncharacterized protein n=1 Tax=Penicillium alfredii TaxID=1506179 RepID=A0A9W9KQ46_9EURO|nr:uncharacterized protein NUU61_000853 [Penicillium alfredii]KAJ5115094.1 hypothetical protein NUU61_000853 [Penicillium alfredii]
MHSSQTPSPFRFSRRDPPFTRRSAGPQFAPTPRFRLSQTTTPHKDSNDGADIIDDDDRPPPTQTEARNPPSSRNPITPRRPGETIEDSDDDELLNDRATGNDNTNELVDDAIDSTPPQEPETPGVLDADFDALFAPGGSSSSQRNPLPDSIRPLSPEVRQPPLDTFDSPHQNATMQETGPQRTPAGPMRPPTPRVSTPGSTKTPFRSRPRFMLSAKKTPSSLPAASTAQTPSISRATSPHERRKPAFVLPRSPSPTTAGEDIPAPFSPSSRTLHRRGGRRSGVPGYLPGGMAAEVRSWILEVGTKREQLIMPAGSQIHAGQTRDPSADELGKYLVAARVTHATQVSCSGSGPLAFIQAQKVSRRPRKDGGIEETVNLILMGLPRSKPGTHLSSQPNAAQRVTIESGDLVGAYRGLAWDVALPSYHANFEAQELQSNSSRNDGLAGEKEIWLMAMEWDLIQMT